MEELSHAVINGSARWDDVQELARLALNASAAVGCSLGPFKRDLCVVHGHDLARDANRTECEDCGMVALRRERDEAVARAEAAEERAGGKGGWLVRLRLALTPLTSETVADAAERVAKERDQAVARADAAEADAKLWRGATATLPLTAEALGKVLAEADGECSWEECCVKDACSRDAAAVARVVMAALSSDAAADAARQPLFWRGSSDEAARNLWRDLLAAAAKAALAVPEQERRAALAKQQTDAPPNVAGAFAASEPEAPPLEWSSWHEPAVGRHESVLRRNIEAIDARLRKAGL